MACRALRGETTAKRRVRRDDPTKDYLLMIVCRFARWLLLLAVIAVSAPAMGLSAQEERTASVVATPATVVGTSGVNIRDCPRADCAVLAVASLGEQLLVTGQAIDGFLPVDWDGVNGFVYALYVATADGGTPELRQGAPGCNRVALIFNVGVGYETRLEPLDYLKAERVPATVFPMGWWAAEHPDLLKRIAAAGFLIGSHGDQRVKLTERSDAEVKEDIRAAAATIERATGTPPEPYFTPYAADMDERVRGLIAREGYLPVAWTVTADDWDFGVTADGVWGNVVPNVHDGAIVEFHIDAPATAESTLIAMPWIVERLRAKGYRFVTIPEMARPCS